MGILKLVVALLALVGTVVQAYQSLRSLRVMDPEAHAAFNTVDDMRLEVPWWRPVRRRSHRSIVNELMKDSPEEARLYRRIRAQLVGWYLLVLASLGAVAVAGLELAGSSRRTVQVRFPSSASSGRPLPTIHGEVALRAMPALRAPPQVSIAEGRAASGFAAGPASSHTWAHTASVSRQSAGFKPVRGTGGGYRCGPPGCRREWWHWQWF